MMWSSEEVDFVAAVQAAAPRVSWAWICGILFFTCCLQSRAAFARRRPKACRSGKLCGCTDADSDGVARGKLDGEPSRSLWCPAGCSQFGFGCDFEAKLLSVFFSYYLLKSLDVPARDFWPRRRLVRGGSVSMYVISADSAAAGHARDARAVGLGSHALLRARLPSGPA